MAIRLMSGLPARVIQVLQDYLPAELDLIDAEEADGITTEDIPDDRYYEWDKPVIAEGPACSIRPVSSVPLNEFEIRPMLMGDRAYTIHRLDVMFHLSIQQSDTSDPAVMQRKLFRYVSGAVRVLCIEKEALQTVADPTRLVELTYWPGEATYGPEEGQEDGATVRTATLPIAIRRNEVR